mmetsp:Transcript_6426/g.13890  ORF Transcript_6426/g.13890 Transcript_6426/m.13890 type:complete len:126 (-) Transcript_6426:653-1030(-)
MTLLYIFQKEAKNNVLEIVYEKWYDKEKKMFHPQIKRSCNGVSLKVVRDLLERNAPQEVDQLTEKILRVFFSPLWILCFGEDEHDFTFLIQCIKQKKTNKNLLLSLQKITFSKNQNIVPPISICL